MNYLAHLHLAALSGHALHGALLGDEVKGKDWQTLPRPLQLGVLQHRAIDSFTDQHPFVRELQTQFGQGQRRFAGIVIDVAIDHWLSRNWAQFMDPPLAHYIATLHQQLQREEHVFALTQYPTFSQYIERIRRMIAEQWLRGYQDRQQAERAVKGIEHRLSRPIALTPIFAQLPAQPEAFVAFYRDAITFAQCWQAPH